LLGVSLLFKYYIAIAIWVVYIIIVYATDYTFGGFLTKQKIYWNSEKDFVIFAERAIATLFYNFAILPFASSEIE
jgi:hypothetical protein